MDNSLKIKLLRHAQGLRQADLAHKAGLDQKTVSYIESEGHQRDEQKLLVALGYTPEMDAMLEGLAAATGNRA